MQVLKITAEGLTTSFRYPHFTMGVQPSYPMPPPATLYGHVASALGRWFDPAGVRFAVRFAYRHKQTDIETTILLKQASGKLPTDKHLPKVLEGKANPFQREILFFPRLVLYLNRPEWASAFRHPRYAVCLGRSQDLFTYTRVEVVTLERAEHVYLQDTLLPQTFGRYTASGQSVSMPRYLDYARKRHPVFERYLVLQTRLTSGEFLYFGEAPISQWWADPTEPRHAGLPFGVVFHSWVEAA